MTIGPIHKINLNVEGATESALQNAAYTIDAEIKRREAWPRRLVFLVPTRACQLERFYDRHQAIKAFEDAVARAITYSRDWERNSDWPQNMKLEWMWERYNPESTPQAGPAAATPEEFDATQTPDE